MRTARKLSIVAALVVTGAISPTAAKADLYAPDASSRTFSGNVGGWTSAIRTEGLCIPAVTCPITANSYLGGGGAGDLSSGFIRTSITYIATVGTKTYASWTSPQFTYTGDRGGQPSKVVFTMDRRANVPALVAAGGSNASYQVNLYNNSTGRDMTLISPTTQLGADAWTAVPQVEIDPSRLHIGDRYQIRITSIYDAFTADVLGSGTSDYDNVQIESSGALTGIADANALRRLILGPEGLPTTASLNSRGDRFSIKVRCPRSAAPSKCRYRSLQGLSGRKGSRRATTRKNVTVAAGKSKTVRLNVRPKFRAHYRKATRITIKTKVSVARLTTTVFKRITLRH